MTTDGWVCVDGNEAAARVAHRLSEVVAIYPITPARPWAELADTWSAAGRPNLWGQVPEVVELQSEAGAAGVLHGAVLKGALATTFTASQGLLLMLPNMFKIAGELTLTVIHVAARTVATHALSIFGDHSDVMAARPTGWPCWPPARSRRPTTWPWSRTPPRSPPGCRSCTSSTATTSHEVAKIQALSDEDLRALVDDADVAAHRERDCRRPAPAARLGPEPGCVFQAREASNPFYAAVPGIVLAKLDELAARTGRCWPGRLRRRPRRRAGAGADGLGAGRRGGRRPGRGGVVGLVTVRLYRPFPAEALAAALPATVRRVAVLDRDQGAGRGRRAAVPGRGLCPGRAGRRRRPGHAAGGGRPPRAALQGVHPAMARAALDLGRRAAAATTSRSGSPTTSP